MPSPLQYAANRLNENTEAVRHSPSEHASAHASAPYPRNADAATDTAGRQGRVRSSMNALRHGLTARVVVLPSEDMDAYHAFSKEIVDCLTGPLYGGLSLDPQTPVERQFAQTVAENEWRINRIRSIEDGMLGMGHFEAAGDFPTDNTEVHSAMTAARAFRDGSKAFVNLSIYEQRLTAPFMGASALHRSMKEALRQLKELQTERRERRKTEMDEAIRLLKAQRMKGLPCVPDQTDFVYASAEIEREERRRYRLLDAGIAEKARFNLAEYEKMAA